MTMKIVPLIFILLSSMLGLSACTEDQMAMSSRTTPAGTPDASQGGELDTEDPVEDLPVMVPPAPVPSDETLVLQLALDNDKTGSP